MDNRTDTWPTHSDVRVGSGREVEGAANVFVPPGGEAFASSCGCSTTHLHEHHHLHDHEPSKVEQLKARSAEIASQLKTRGIETMDTLKREVSERGEVLKRELASRGETLKREMSARGEMLKREMSTQTERAKHSLARAQVTAKENMTTQVNRMNWSMRTDPMKWAGIAAGSGVVLGLIGRYVHWRSTRPVAPSIVIVEAC